LPRQQCVNSPAYNCKSIAVNDSERKPPFPLAQVGEGLVSGTRHDFDHLQLAGEVVSVLFIRHLV
jgi:hypothetical protein